MIELIRTMPGKTVTYNRNDYLKTPGTADRNVYYIESGSVRIYRLDGKDEQNIRFGYQGNVITSLDSFLSGKPSELYIQAIKKTVVKLISIQAVEVWLKQEDGHQYWLNFLEQLALQQMEREYDLLTASPKERFERVLKRSPGLFQKIPHRHIANYLRMSAETLSRLKKS